MKLLQRILLALLLLGSSVSLSLGIELRKEVLPGTKPLTLEGDLAERMLSGAHRFLDRKLAETLACRPHSRHGQSMRKTKPKRSTSPQDNTSCLHINSQGPGNNQKAKFWSSQKVMWLNFALAKLMDAVGYS